MVCNSCVHSLLQSMHNFEIRLQNSDAILVQSYDGNQQPCVYKITQLIQMIDHIHLIFNHCQFILRLSVPSLLLLLLFLHIDLNLQLFDSLQFILLQNIYFRLFNTFQLVCDYILTSLVQSFTMLISLMLLSAAEEGFLFLEIKKRIRVFVVFISTHNKLLVVAVLLFWWRIILCSCFESYAEEFIVER